MTEKEDFNIKEPYQPSEEEKQAIYQLEKSNGQNNKNWNSKNKYIISFKENLRQDMYMKQNELCAYCRIHVPPSCVPMHCEHIVYKNKYPQWMFLPENLCVSCPCCNRFKGTTEVLVDPQTKKYPHNSRGFKIIHPIYDNYSEHIELIGDIIYRGKTEKGVFTIMTCHLYRVGLAIERVEYLCRAHNKEKILDKLMHLLLLIKSSNHYVDDKEKLIRHVQDIVKKYKSKQIQSA